MDEILKAHLIILYTCSSTSASNPIETLAVVLVEKGNVAMGTFEGP
jgi:hypothetical protein